MWVGLRPVSPDDVPIIGQSSKFENLYFNVGHGSRGMKLSLGSSILLKSIMTGETSPIPLEGFNP